MNFDFGEVLTRAWKITWKYKVLWIFGILASCSRGGGGGGGRGGDGNHDQNWNGGSPSFNFEWEHSFQQAGNWMAHNWWIFALIFLAVLVLAVLVIFLGNIGRIGLIRGTLQAEAGAEKLTFGELFSGSLPYFWRVFGLNFIISLIALLIVAPMTVFGIFTGGFGFLCLLPIICILIPVGIVVGLILELADVAIVRDNTRMWEGWQRGWDMVRTNLGPVLGMAVILFVIEFVVSVAIIVPVFIITLPTMIAFFASNGHWMVPLIVGSVCFAVLLPVLLLISGILNTYIGSAWTLTYLRLSPAAAASVESNTPVVTDEPQA